MMFFFHQNCRNKCDFNFERGFKKTVKFSICNGKSAFWKPLWGLSKSWYSIVFRIFNSFFETTSFIWPIFLKPHQVSTIFFFFLGKFLKIFKKILVSWPIFGRNLAKMRVSKSTLWFQWNHMKLNLGAVIVKTGNRIYVK